MIAINKHDGKKYRIYNLSCSWACIIPEYGEISDKIMIPIGDFHEDYITRKG
jgi:hypothetical protein